MKKATIISLGILTILGFWLYVTNTSISQDFDNFKIVHISDLHNHNWKGKLVTKIKKEKPDIIVITGDLVDSSKPNFDLALDLINNTKHLAPIYYVTGNHEAWLSDYQGLKVRLEKAGVNMLDDKSMFIEKGQSLIQIVGISDPDFDQSGSANYIQASLIEDKLTHLINKDFYNILLSHRPEHFLSYVSKDVDLVLSGHAHGGQVRLPFIGGLIAPNQGFLPQYTSGIYSERDTSMVVSRGLGNSIIFIRVNNTPELVVIRLKSK